MFSWVILPYAALVSRAVEVPEREIPLPVRLWDGPPLQGDDYPLEFYEDGFPKLPACLDRKASELFIQ